MKPRVLAFFAVYNEESHVVKILERFVPVLKDHLVDELLVVDDGSTDRTPELIRGGGVKTIRHEQRRGVGLAIRTAIAFARENKFDVLVVLAGNDKDRPHEIPRLLQPILAEGCDFVQGSRYLPGGDFGNMPRYRRLATQFVHPWLFSLITRRRITDSTNGFRAFRLAILDDARLNINQPWLNDYELEPYLFFKAIRLGFKVREVPVTKIYPPKALGYTKMKPISGWWSILRPLIFLGLGLRK